MKRKTGLYPVIFILIPFLPALLIWPSAGSAQSGAPPAVNERPFDREVWRKATEDLDYFSEEDTLRREQDSLQQRERTESPPPNRNSWGDFWRNFRALGVVLRILVIVLVGILLFFLLRSLLGMDIVLRRKRNKDTEATEALDVTQIEENLPEQEPEDYIGRAVAQGNYPLALRLQYLSVLKALAAGRFIRWKRDKTNRDYLLELRNTKLQPTFREITRIFEEVWYGEHRIGAGDYAALAEKFERMVAQIRQQRSKNL